jgi:beta-mannosidase
MNWPEPYRYLTWPKDTQVSITVTKKQQISISGSSGCGEKDVDEVKIIANQPCKGLFLSVEGDDEGTEEPEWDDNMVDLMPEEELRIGVSGLKGRKVRARFLAAWEVDDAVRYVEE